MVKIGDDVGILDPRSDCCPTVAVRLTGSDKEPDHVGGGLPCHGPDMVQGYFYAA